MQESLGHYRLIRKVGEGGMGEVYLARDDKLERNVALKLLSSGPRAAPQAEQRFLSEARAASALNHPNVCVIHEIGQTEDGRHFIAMEFVEGTSLARRLEQGAVAMGEVVEVALQVADALDAAHSKGVVHRDIKPDNICLDARGRVKVLDFGLAKRLQDGTGAPEQLSLTQSGTILGTPAYMSPEQVLGKGLDHRTDIFSLGVVLYELVTGRLPFQGNSFAEIADRIVHARPEALARFSYDVTPELERIIRKCLEKEPGRRYQSARELWIDLEASRRELADGSGGAAAPAPGSVTVAVGNLEAVPAALAPPSPSPALKELKKSDIFISYSHVDDQPLSPGRSGWISQFQRHLELRLRQLSGEKVTIWRPPRQTADLSDSRVLELLPEAKALVSVVSPPFARSESCRREVRTFVDSRLKRSEPKAADKSRLLKVVKTPVPDIELGDLADVFRSLIGYDFFDEDPSTGRIREFDEVFGEEARQRYYERVYDLAYEINELLRIEREAEEQDASDASGNGRGKTVYLAVTTSDLQAEYDAVRRELLEQGYRVLPDKPLPMIREELEQAVRACLAESELVVQLAGRNYGLVPENARQSVGELQAEWAAACQRDGGCERFVWLPSGLEVADERQASFIRRLREQDAAEPGTELVEGSLSVFKELLGRAIRGQDRDESRPPDGEPSAGPPQVYLICDQEDESAVEALEDYLFDHGLEVCLPDFGSAQEQMGETHRENLRDCDAVLVYYGRARKAWVDIKLRDFLKASGYGRSKPFAALGVYIAPPDDRRKERFKSHLANFVIRQTAEGFTPSPELESFVARARAAR